MKREIDYILIISVIAVIAIGVVSIYSAGAGTEHANLWMKQIFWTVVGLGIMTVVMFIPPRLFFSFSNIIYILLLTSLLAVIFFGSYRMGAKRWIVLGPYQLQPSEFGKLFLVFVLAKFYGRKNIDWSKLRNLGYGAIITLIPAFLVFRQPDLGTSLVYIAIYISMMFAAGVPIYYLFNIFMILVSIITRSLGIQFFITAMLIYGVILNKFGKCKFYSIILLMLNIFVGLSTTFIWDKLKPYQKMRILSFLDPEKYSLGGGWQIIQSKVAVANGGIIGEGFTKGSQTQLRFLPEGHTDFIFSVIAEEWGTLGIFILFSLVGIILYRLMKITVVVKNRYYYLTACGITAIFIYQIFINIAMTVGFMPITGLPLPFLSYGGSSLMFNLILIGIMLNFSRNRRDF